jgi:hypothetical protein
LLLEPRCAGQSPAALADLDRVSALAEPLRRRLFDYVRERQGPVGRDGAATATRVSRSLAAYHLDKLARLGLLEVEYGRPPDAAAQAPAGPRSSTGRQRASSRSAFRRAITDFSPSAWHLGLTEGAAEETKARYAFVYGDFRRLRRMGLIACH